MANPGGGELRHDSEERQEPDGTETEREEEESQQDVTDQDDDDDRSSRPDRPHEVVIVVGPSGSGKSSAVRAALGNERFVVLNDRKEDSPFAGAKISWERLFKKENTAVVVEDFVNASEAELRHLRELVNVRSRQKGLTPVYLIAHSLVGTNTNGLLPFATRILLSAHAGNSQSLSRALSHYSFSKEQREKAKEAFATVSEPFQFFEIDVRHKTFGPFKNSSSGDRGAKGRGRREEIDGRSDSERRQAAQHTARNLLSLLPSPDLAFAIFHLILPYLPRSLRPEDLTVLMETERTGRPVRISIVDYVGLLLSDGESPADEISAFHDFMSERVVIPKLFQKNKLLISRSQK